MSNRAFETLGKRKIGIILGGAMVLGAAVWIASTVGIPPSSPRMGFIHSRFTLPRGWSAGPITRTGASQFRAATDTRTVYGPDGFHIQLTYTPGVPNAGNFGWIPPGPPGTMEPGESRLNPWSSPYAAITWTPRAVGQGYVAETVATLGGTYRWQTSTFSRKGHSTLYRMILRWANTAHYPSVISPTKAVHAMMAAQRLRAYPFPYTELGPNGMVSSLRYRRRGDDPGLLVRYAQPRKVLDFDPYAGHVRSPSDSSRPNRDGWCKVSRRATEGV